MKSGPDAVKPGLDPAKPGLDPATEALLLPPASGADPFIVAIDGYEGPLDLLLALAREQKVDLLQISIEALADQYLDFIHRAQFAEIEFAAEYLVMAAWLAYLKSRLLLPAAGEPDAADGEEIAAALQARLAQLDVMQAAAAALVRRPRLGAHF
ncbi:MAG: ScpA family protein, partial [Defluviicoccus sp.]